MKKYILFPAFAGILLPATSHSLRAADAPKAPSKNQSVLNAFDTGASNKVMAQAVLATLSEEDREVVSLEVLIDALNFSTGSRPELLAQRIADEPLTPYKAFLQSQLPAMSPEQWEQWMEKNISLIPDTGQPCADPITTFRRRKGDERSRNVLFVAGARALGFPAHLDSATGKPIIIKGEREK